MAKKDAYPATTLSSNHSRDNYISQVYRQDAENMVLEKNTQGQVVQRLVEFSYSQSKTARRKKRRKKKEFIIERRTKD